MFVVKRGGFVMYKDQPWPLEEKAQETKKSEKSSKKGIKTEAKKRLYSADVAVSTARVLKLFEDHKERIYTNREIAQELGLSESTVTGINTRLEGVKKIKIVEVLQRLSAYTPIYQHINGSCNKVNKRRGKDGNQKDVAQVVYDLFENDKNAVYTKPEIIEKLSNYSKGQVEESIKVLVLSKAIKILEDYEGNVMQYQHALGNKKGVDLQYEPDEKYTTVGAYLDSLNYVGDREKLRRNLPKHYRVFYSARGVRPEYLKSDLNKAIEKSEKKGFFRKVFG